MLQVVINLKIFCMYDILQLNDMLVPELLDIAEQLKIPNAKKMDKQELVYKILDGQAIAGSKSQVLPAGEEKRKRNVLLKHQRALLLKKQK